MAAAAAAAAIAAAHPINDAALEHLGVNGGFG